jgi:hypothetical protein
LIRCTAMSIRDSMGTNRMNGGAGGRLGEQGVQIAQLLLQFAELAEVDGRGSIVDGEGELGLFLLQFRFEDLAGAWDGVALVVEKGFDTEGHFDVAAPVEALAGAAFVRLELGELALPETEDVGGNLAEFRHFADTEVELVRDVGPG